MSRYGLRLAGVIAILAAVVCVAIMLHADSQVDGSVVARPLNWVAALVTLLVIVGVGWILLGQRRATGEEGNHQFEHARCPSCQREVFGKWRMCPYCGDIIDRAHPAAAMTTGSADQ